MIGAEFGRPLRFEASWLDLNLTAQTFLVRLLPWVHDDLERFRIGVHTPVLGAQRYEVAKVWLVLAVLHLLPTELVTRHARMIERITKQGRMLGILRVVGNEAEVVDKALHVRWTVGCLDEAIPLL